MHLPEELARMIFIAVHPSQLQSLFSFDPPCKTPNLLNSLSCHLKLALIPPPHLLRLTLEFGKDALKMFSLLLVTVLEK